MKELSVVFQLLFLFPLFISAQEVVDLYKGPVPNSRPAKVEENSSLLSNGMYNRVTKPTVEIYLPKKEKASGAAVIICPGGSYKVIVYQPPIAFHNASTSFFLKYHS